MYLKAYDSVSAARADIAEYFDWYNSTRAHSSLADQTPDQTYWQLLPMMKAVAKNEFTDAPRVIHRGARSCSVQRARTPPWITLHLQPARSPTNNRGLLFRQPEPPQSSSPAAGLRFCSTLALRIMRTFRICSHKKSVLPLALHPTFRPSNCPVHGKTRAAIYLHSAWCSTNWPPAHCRSAFQIL